MKFSQNKSIESLFPDDNTVREAGKMDGIAGLPSGNSYEIGPFERSILQAGESQISLVYSDTAKKLHKKEGDTSELLNAFEATQYRLREILTRYRDRKKVLGRDIIVPIPYFIHWLIIVLLGIGEFPLNVVVFRMFGEPEMMTYVMSLTLSLTLPLIGLFLGLQIRTLVRPKIATAIIIVVAPITVLGALFSLSFIRNMYVEMKTEHQMGTNSISMMYAMFAINLLIFVGSYLVSFFAHDEDGELDALHVAVVKLDRKRGILRKKLSRAISRTNAIIRDGRGQAERILAEAGKKISLYRQMNMASRGGTVAPSSFSKAPVSETLGKWWPDFKIPDTAESLVEKTKSPVPDETVHKRYL